MKMPPLKLFLLVQALYTKAFDDFLKLFKLLKYFGNVALRGKKIIPLE